MTDVLVERDGPTALVTFNRPDARNAMTFEMYDALHDLCERLDADPEVRVVILKGAGDRAFASGTDIRPEVEEHEPGLSRRGAGLSRQAQARMAGTVKGSTASP